MSGRRLPQRLRLGPLEVDKYFVERAGGFAYMRRLRAIEDEEARHLRELEEAWHTLAEECDDAAFARVWRETAASWDFRRVNTLIAKHNEFFPVEAQVPMNPRTGDYAKSWRREPYDAAWILERYPPRRDSAFNAVRRG